MRINVANVRAMFVLSLPVHNVVSFGSKGKRKGNIIKRTVHNEPTEHIV